MTNSEKDILENLETCRGLSKEVVEILDRYDFDKFENDVSTLIKATERANLLLVFLQQNRDKVLLKLRKESEYFDGN